ncbi:MAG: hypothetical protein EP330_18395 [Deltaproteobacteria bacterium]|nr:MAG: hypothetical protein EP330_18395 [Deltaproteobacteria bacterium]
MTRLLIPLLLSALAAPVAMAGEVDQAEVTRLRTEMQRLAERSAWAGVERVYVALVEQGAELGYDDHFLGAQSSKALGDVAAARQRLLLANSAKESQDVMDWLFAIDSNYGEVRLKVAKGGGAELKPAEQPFAADQRAAIEFAAARLAETGTYNGYLPSGQYTLGDQSFQALPRVAAVEVDLTSKSGGKTAAADPSESVGTTAEPAKVKPAGDDGDAIGMLSIHAGGGTSYGWVGVGGVLHLGPVGLRAAGGYDPVYGIMSGQAGLRVYPAGFTEAGPGRIAPMVEVAAAPLRWKEAGVALYGPAVSVGAEAVFSGIAVDVQVGGGVTRDGVRDLTRPGLLMGIGLGYNFL